jgi:hypothetical protein
MNHLDLTEALRVGTERLRLAGHEPADQLAGAVLLGAAPVIERQVRERIAAELMAQVSEYNPPGDAFMRLAAVIARDGAGFARGDQP